MFVGQAFIQEITWGEGESRKQRSRAGDGSTKDAEHERGPAEHCELPQSEVIRTGFALENTTFSSQSATVLVASLLLYV